MSLGADHVLRARVVSASPERASVRVRRALEQAELRPPGLPEHAVLCVRQLRCPPRSTSGDRLAWADEVRGRLADVASRAVRPALGHSSSEAVWFADLAEVLVAVSLDASLGRRSWWWDGLVGPDRTDAALSVWLDHVEHAPAALDRLESGGALLEALALWLPQEARALLEAMCLRFAVLHLVSGLDEVVAALEADMAALADPTHASAPRLEPALRALAPWLGSTPSASAPQALALQVLGLGLHRAPGRIRSHELAHGLSALVAGRGEARTPDTLPLSPRRSQRPPAQPGTAQPEGQLTALPEVAHRPPRSTGHPARPEPVAAPPATLAPHPPPPHPAQVPAQDLDGVTFITADVALQHEPAPTGRPQAPEAPMTPARPAEGGRQEPAPGLRALPSASAPRAPVPAPLDLLPIPIATGLGGAFYLLNVALFEGIYGDMSSPMQPGVDLSPWDWLTLVCPGLHPAADRQDALWDLLARLAGRPPSVSPGADLPPPPAWRTRPGWPAAAREAPPTSLAGWMDQLVPALEGRLAHALPERSAAQLIAEPGLVLWSSARIEVVFSLSSHPIDVRLSGLDRDPGWIPAAGVDLRFRFD